MLPDGSDPWYTIPAMLLLIGTAYLTNGWGIIPTLLIMLIGAYYYEKRREQKETDKSQ
tara:strand:+ start:6568 stop:6741 length:174 start_codon:yes stop_codon:yes gene_type:complete